MTKKYCYFLRGNEGWIIEAVDRKTAEKLLTAEFGVIYHPSSFSSYSTNSFQEIMDILQIKEIGSVCIFGNQYRKVFIRRNTLMKIKCPECIARKQ